MQKENSNSPIHNLHTSAVATTTADEKSSTSDTSSPHLSSNPFLSPTSHQNHYNSTDLISASYPYGTLFPKSPSETSFDDSERLFIVEYQQLYNRYTLCLARLQESLKEVDGLLQENESLRLANADLAQRLSLLSQATIHNCLLSDFNRLGVGVPDSHLAVVSNEPQNVRPTSVIEQNQLDRRGSERVTLPKSISVRSSGYLRLRAHAGNNGGPSHSSSRNRQSSPSLSGSQRVYVPGGKTEEEALEFEVYNQGMFKTELCNKWQETGACPYGDNCQFAHGITELRPVIRHPRYKTEVCRMVLAGDICPYGHRCHFRHALTDEERLMALQC